MMKWLRERRLDLACWLLDGGSVVITREMDEQRARMQVACAFIADGYPEGDPREFARIALDGKRQ